MKIRPSGKPGKVTIETSRKDEKLLEQAAEVKPAPLPIRRILVPVDFSEYSYKSLDYATAFAAQSKAEITLLHVVPLNYVDTELIAFDYAQLEKQTAAACQTRLEKLRDERLAAGF